MADVEQAREMRIVERLDESDVVETGQPLVHDRPDVGVKVDREDDREVRLSREQLDRLRDAFHALAEVLAAMTGHANDALAREPALQLRQPGRQAGLPFDTRRHPVQRINHRVAGHVDRARIDVLAPQRFGSGLGWSAMQRGYRPDDFAVHFLGPRVVDVAAPEPGLDMRDRDLAIVGGESARHGGRRVTLDHYPFGLLFVHHSAEPGQQGGGQRVERLAGAHQVKIVIGRDAGNLQHLVEHPAMLRADADAAVEAAVGLESMDEREQLDRFGPGAEDREDAPRHGASFSSERLSALLNQFLMSDGSTTTGASDGAEGGATSPASSRCTRSMYCRSNSSTRAWVSAASASIVERRSSRA